MALIDFDLVRPSSRVDEVANLLLWWAGWTAPQDRDPVFAGIDVAAHARADLAAHGDQRRATTRVFGSKPGSYGAGILQVVETGTWRDDKDLAEVYTAWGGFAYGRGLDGAPAAEDGLLKAVVDLRQW